MHRGRKCHQLDQRSGKAILEVMRRVMRVNSFPLKGPNIAFVWKFFFVPQNPEPVGHPTSSGSSIPSLPTVDWQWPKPQSFSQRVFPQVKMQPQC